ncbi:MAG: hypothetical protein WDA06_00045 [Phenylobacterium sp.]
MEYKIKTITVEKLLVSYDGVVTSLCDKCGSLDCSNIVENRTISIFGKNETHKVIKRGKSFFFVVECEGFINND